MHLHELKGDFKFHGTVWGGFWMQLDRIFILIINKLLKLISQAYPCVQLCFALQSRLFGETKQKDALQEHTKYSAKS